MNKCEKLKIGLYSPYLDVLGGGERYILTIASYLSQKNEVFLFGQRTLVKDAKEIFGIDLSKIKFVSSDAIARKSSFQKLRTLLHFDIFFYMTDGSLFLSSSHNNILLVQSPAHIPPNKWWNKMKLYNWKIVCNSVFTQNVLSDRLHEQSEVIYPPVDTDSFTPKAQKENIILIVGRFFSALHSKKQYVLVEAFKRNYKKFFNTWKMIIVGGLTEQSGKEIIQALKNQSKGYPIKIVSNLPFTQLVRLYNKAKIYWHGAGYGEDTYKNPEKAEHFGITTVEAMAAGSIPLVFNAGGQKEIIQDGINGFLWDSIDELVEKTSHVINDRSLYQTISENARKRAQEFSKTEFYEKIEQAVI